MDIYEIMANADGGVLLTGGPLADPLNYDPPDAEEMATRMVGFLSQKMGSELRVVDADGKLVRSRKFEPMIPLESDSMGQSLSSGIH